MITVVGETLVDQFEVSDEGLSEQAGGSPANVAVALARLGVTVRLVTQLGRDPQGRMLLRHLRDNDVAVAPGSVDDDYVTSIARTIVTNGQADYAFRVSWEPLSPSARQALIDVPTTCLHTGSIAALAEPGADSLQRAVLESRSRATITFDLNCRPSILGPPAATRRRAEALAAASDIVKASEDDIHWLYEGRSPRAVAARWLELGAALVVVTRGAQGAWATTSDVDVSVRAEPIEVVDTVGAGDSFMAGLLAMAHHTGLLGSASKAELRHLDRDTVTGLLQAATQVAAVTCGRRGANSPTAAELAAFGS